MPRIVIDLARTTDPAGWTVTVRGAGVDHHHFLAAQAVQRDHVTRWVPSAPAPAEELEKLLERIDTRSIEAGDVRYYGRWLFGGLLGAAWAEIKGAPEVQKARGVELALRWPVSETDLHRLVWEAMHDGEKALAANGDLLIAITRLVPVSTAAVATIERTPRVLFAVGGALADEVIRPGAMFMGLLRGFDAKGVCSAKAAHTLSLNSLTELCSQFRPDLVHIVAHGGNNGRPGIMIGDEHVTADKLAPALTADHRPLAVVLSACNSGSDGGADGSGPLAAELVEQGIPIVSAVSGEVSEQACRLYTRRLVEAISDGTPLAVAAARGRRAALIDSEAPRERLDWAMPSLFVSESVPASFRPVDARARHIVDVAHSLKLREWPLFIGRTSILDLVDDIFADDASPRLSVVGAIGDDISGLGGTRLLREMGYLLLLRGHLPLMLGPFDSTSPPGTLRALLSTVLGCIEILVKELGLDVPRLRVLNQYYRAAPGEQDRLSRLIAFNEAKARFNVDDSPLDWSVETTKLAADLGELTRAAQALAEPFGAHSRVVLLADDIHRWGVVPDLLNHLKSNGRNGFGLQGRPVPMIFTSSTGVPSGAAVKSFCDSMANMPGYLFPKLGPLPEGEAVIGFQWILLNPASLGDSGDSTVYAAQPDARYDDLAKSFKIFRGKPTVVREPVLYEVAQLLEHFNVLVSGDDDAAWSRYEKKYS